MIDDPDYFFEMQLEQEAKEEEWFHHLRNEGYELVEGKWLDEDWREYGADKRTA